ncbi:P12 family lipoprotein (plasmid) [Borrelia parkeri]|uniref:P12 family lipoprotein n=1 Tax=Borrelia parkeri TaxID=141 RepID=UPI001FF11ABB|nr:P12 family lipoprotein [Borrelia parkeri]UPA11340.1 P12 family lipoprotein [Borrelia parkeri]UPA11427.1 P12 family lipoprotein [Borrelia parkeri]
MKRSILSVCILALLCLLSCDINALNDLLNEVREKVLDESKDNKDLNHKQENQEQKEVVIDAFEEGVEIKQDMQVVPVAPVISVNADNVEKGMPMFYPYYSQEEIEIKEEDLTPSTDEEIKAQEEIENIKSALGDSGFQQLIIKNALEFKDRYELGRADFYDIMGKFQSERISLTKKRKENIEKIRKLTQLQNKFNDERSNLERLMNEVDSGFNELESAKYFFEKAEKTLRESMIERLRNKRRSYWSRKVDSDFLARQALREAENALKQLESSSVKLIEAMAKIKEIEELISEAKTVL